jgi:hypothetical protein
MSDILQALMAQYHDDLVDAQKDANEVIGRYGKLFHPHYLVKLTAEDFRSFLLYKNNKHWDGIHRQSSILTEDMALLRKVLGILLDETRPLKDRLSEIFPKGANKMLKGLGRAVATPILHVVYPDKYGVYNRKSEDGLKSLRLFPDLPRSTSFAEEYIAVNERLLSLSSELGISLWKLDTLWHLLLTDSDMADSDQAALMPTSDEVVEDQLAYFSLERHLSDFLYRNWDRTELAKDYDLYDEGGETALEYATEVGRIDLLARDKDRKAWLVVELKRGRSSDEVVGQVLRYMGWVQANLANDGEVVRGMIILGEPDERIRYALEAARAEIHLYSYKIDFTLTRLR